MPKHKTSLPIDLVGEDGKYIRDVDRIVELTTVDPTNPYHVDDIISTKDTHARDQYIFEVLVVSGSFVYMANKKSGAKLPQAFHWKYLRNGYKTIFSYHPQATEEAECSTTSTN